MHWSEIEDANDIKGLQEKLSYLAFASGVFQGFIYRHNLLDEFNEELPKLIPNLLKLLYPEDISND